VNTISTGLIESNEETAEWMANPAIREWLERLVPLPYFGTPDDIAWACVYLASDEARYVTAATLHVDGGATG
jgi:NAD(P)-dependent dehydrogenase (short-subunit alcohol dehydrogenase family)